MIYSLLNDKKSAQKVWSKDLVYGKTFQLSSHTPRIQFNVLSGTECKKVKLNQLKLET